MIDIKRLTSHPFSIAKELEEIAKAVEETKDEDEFQLPSGKDPGWILFRILTFDENESGNAAYSSNSEFQILGHDGAAFWIGEAIGFDYWLNEILPEIAEEQPDLLKEGKTYVIEGIIVHFYRGDGWTTDDDEEYEFDSIRLATETEIRSETVQISAKSAGSI